MKIKICIPFYKEFEACKRGLGELTTMKDCPEMLICTGQGYDPALGRNMMVSESQKKRQTDFGGFTHFLFIDSDISFRARDVQRLVAHDKEIVSGAYIRRDAPHFFQGGFWQEDLPGNIKNFVVTTSRGFHQVDYVGGGFLLVKAEALVKMEYPWFRRTMIDNGDSQSQVSEDYGFCLNARENGVEIFLDCDVVVDHILGSMDDSPSFIPADMSEDILKITEALAKFSRKYTLCYNELVSARAMRENQHG